MQSSSKIFERMLACDVNLKVTE